MRFRWIRRLVPAFVLLAWVAPVLGQSLRPFALPFAWWRDGTFQKALGLTSEQSGRIDLIFQAAMPQLRQKKAELDAREAELSRLIETEAEEPAIAKQSEQVEAVRAALNTARTLMLVHMNQVLSPDQRVRFKILREQREQGQRDYRPTANSSKDNSR
jgi:Spy/CpxP family protein refolding chaperone